MSISNRAADTTRGARSRAGFTLLEIMVTLAVVALAIIPLLTIREAATNIAARSSHMMQALNLAQRLLAERMTDPEVLKERTGVFDDAPGYRYELSIEDFDLGTGRVDDPNQDPNDPYSVDSQFAPSDAGVPPGMEDEDVDDPDLVRRLKVSVFYPGMEDDREEKVVLEGFIPRATEKEAGTLLKKGP